MVLGLGVIGLGAVVASKMAGGKVFAITNHDYTKKIALEIGADEVFSRNDISNLKSLLGSRLADAVITTSNTWSDWELALDVAGINGKICILGFQGEEKRIFHLIPLIVDIYIINNCS